MEKCAIAVLIPVYNGGKYLTECFDSVLAQTFEHYKVLTFDDNSLDGSNIVCQDYAARYPEKFQGIDNRAEQQWNGGSRNVLLRTMEQVGINPEYVLFMDDDDRLVDNTVLQRVWDFTLEQGCPDVVRLGYRKKYANHFTDVIINDKTPAEMANNPRVAPWTKLVKKKILLEAPFPENTLFEDVVQHLRVADKIETVASVDFPVVEWNRCNPHSASTEVSPKRKSSAIRFVADLMDLELEKPYTQKRRDFKIRDAASNLGMDFDNIDWKRVCC